MPRQKIFIERAEDRDAAAQILARNGYTVRIWREKRGRQNKYDWYVEYWTDGDGTDGI